MNATELDYELPKELIAQHPLEPRDASRLLVYSRESGEIRHRSFGDLVDELPPGTVTVVNDTRVVPGRIAIERPRGEVLLLERLGGDEWGGTRPPDAPSSRRRALRRGGAARAPRCGALAPPARRRGRRPDTASAVYHRAACRPCPLPDRVRVGGWLGCGADGRVALHAEAARAARRGARDASCRPRHVSAPLGRAGRRASAPR